MSQPAFLRRRLMLDGLAMTKRSAKSDLTAVTCFRISSEARRENLKRTRIDPRQDTSAVDPYVWSGPGELVSERNRQHCELINAPLPRSFVTGAPLKLQE